MAKLKSPLFSLDAHGSIGKSVTYQVNSRLKIARVKPPTPGGITLPRQYQRWLYQDYVYLWSKQTPAVQAQYRSAGVRFHLTGFQYWMKYNLTYLPDIIAIYHLDHISGGLVLDSSRNGHTGTVTGAIPATGKIAGGLYFDGLNDYVTTPGIPTLDTADEIGIDAFIRLDATDTRVICARRVMPDFDEPLYFSSTSRFLNFAFNVAGVWKGNVTGNYLLTLGEFYHVGLSYNRTDYRYYVNGLLDVARVETAAMPTGTGVPLVIGAHGSGTQPFKGIIDHLIIRKRAPDASEFLRWSERSYAL